MCVRELFLVLLLHVNSVRATFSDWFVQAEHAVHVATLAVVRAVVLSQVLATVSTLSDVLPS